MAKAPGRRDEVKDTETQRLSWIIHWVPRNDRSPYKGPTNTVILDFRPHSCERINLFFFKLLSLWKFVISAVGN